MPKPAEDATVVLASLAAGDPEAADRLLPMVYGELRALAGSYFRGQPADHTLEPTALVHEVYLKLVNQSAAGWNDRAHFFAVAATAMRQILVSHARKRQAGKRGGGRRRVPMTDATPIIERDDDLIGLDDALTELARLHERKARVVEMRFFGGMTVAEVSGVLGVSTTTVEEDWRMARAWLLHQFDPDAGA